MVMNDINFNARKVYSLSWSEFSSSLSAAAQNLRNKEDLIDITICAGGKNFSAHRLILSAASPLLMDLLKNATCQHPILMLAGISASDLEFILDFIYQGEINIDSEKLPSLLQAAQFLDIRALLPETLILNSFQSSLPVYNHSNEEITDILSENEGEVEQDRTNKNSDLQVPQRKRKRVKSSEMVGHKTEVNSSNSENAVKVFKKSILNTELKSPIQAKVDESTANKESIIFGADEKKIISDLPVNCKICGVTIRQSRNLRRHMDQMHSKPKQKHNQQEKKEKIAKLTSSKNDSILDFSDDSFNQLTEEIFNYSNTPVSVSNSNAFSSTSTISPPSTIDGCLIEDVIPTNAGISTSPASSTLLCAFSMGSVPQLNTLYSDVYYIPPGNSTSCASVENQKKSNALQKNENCEYNDLGEENTNDNVHDIVTLKELDNQLLSICFRSNDSDVNSTKTSSGHFKNIIIS